VIDGADLVVCKAMFDRSKDWADIEAIAVDGRTDLGRARSWIYDLVGPDALQLERLDSVIKERSASRASPSIGPPPLTRPSGDPGLGL